MTMPIMIYDTMESYSSRLRVRDALCLQSDTLVSLVFINLAWRLLVSRKYNELQSRVSREVITPDQQIKFINHFNGHEICFPKGVTDGDVFSSKSEGGARKWISEYFADAL